MPLTMLRLLALVMSLGALKASVRDHRQFQYNSQVDQGGNYNFAYDTGSRSTDAHTMHQEYRDSSGIVRGRYGYTDPRGKLRIVEYEAGPGGYKARGDVGPDLFPHMEAPGLAPPNPHPVPSPLQLSGWNPVTNPIENPIQETEVEYQGQLQKSYSDSERYIANRQSSQLPSRQERYESNAYVASPRYVSKTYNGQKYVCRTYDDGTTPRYVCRAYDAIPRYVSRVDNTTPKYTMSRDYHDRSRYVSRFYDTKSRYMSKSNDATPRYVIKTYNGQQYVCRNYDDVPPRYVCRADDATPKYVMNRAYYTTPRYISRADSAMPRYVRQGRSLEPLTAQTQQLTISNIDVNPDDIRMAAPPTS